MTQEKAFSKRLIAEGIMPNIRGYYFLLDALVIASADPRSLWRDTASLYHKVAEKRGTNAANVSRSIVYAIERTKYNLSNSQFIGMIAEEVRLETAG